MSQALPDILYIKKCHFLARKDKLFEQIYQQSNWQEEYIKMFGKTIKCPRKISYYGDRSVFYKYSGNQHEAQNWYPLLEEMKNQIEEYTSHKFNFALLNYYRNGEDYMGWHSDDEKELGDAPIIASVSLGAARVMKFKHKHNKIFYELVLNDLSLLIMKGATQKEWLHSIPKSSKITSERINITFRLVYN